MFNIYVFTYAQMLFIIYAHKRIEHDLLIIKKYVFITYVIAHPSPRTHPAIKYFNFLKLSIFKNSDFSIFTSIFNLPAAIASADTLGWSVRSRVTPRSLLTGKNSNRSLLTGKHSIAYHHKRSASIYSRKWMETEKS